VTDDVATAYHDAAQRVHNLRLILARRADEPYLRRRPTSRSFIVDGVLDALLTIERELLETADEQAGHTPKATGQVKLA
jgi:hypothetical protein